MKRKVYLAMPTRDKPEIETSFALLRALRDCEKADIAVKLKYIKRPSILPKCRNAFVADFLASDCTDLLMIDDDVAWEDGAVLRLLSHPCDVVAGIYPKREDPIKFPVRRIPGEKVDVKTGLMKVALVPTGFLRMTRACLERMTSHYSNLAYRDDEVPGGIAHALFWFDLNPDPDTGEVTVWGEDFTFCRRWTEMGGVIHLDTLLRFQHIGPKAFEGCYADLMPVSDLFEAAA
jgi:hypothetical protein